MLEIKLKNTYKKLIHYFSIFTIILGTTFGALNSANAAVFSALDLADTVNDGAATTVLSDGTAIDMNETGTLTVTVANGVETATSLGAITQSAGDPTLVIQNLAADVDDEAIAISSITFAVANEGDITITTQNNAADDGDLAVTIGNLSTLGTLALDGNDVGGALSTLTVNLTGTTAVTEASTAVGAIKNAINLNISGTSTTFTNGFEMDDVTGTVTLTMSGSTAQTFTGAVTAADAGDSKIDITNTAGTTFASAIGADGTNVGEVDVNTNAIATFNSTIFTTTLTQAGTATFKGAVGGATTATLTGDTTFNSTLAAATVDINSGTQTFSGKVTASTKIDVAGASTIVNINAAPDTANLTVAEGVVNISVQDVDIDDLDLNSGDIVVKKTVTNGQSVFLTATQGDTLDGTGEIYMPVNLSNGQTLVLFEDGDNSTVTALEEDDVEGVVVDTALTNYVASETGFNVVVTSTDKSSTTTASELGVTINDAKALLQLRNAAISDANADGDAEDAVFNALNAKGGFSATEDTSLAKQAAPQTDMISGSSLASKAVTGTVQGIISNRMASLRSGDAYYGMGMSAGNMTAKSGFIQAFGSEVEQKNKTVGSGTQYGYESSSAGIALGFDGTTDTGATVGLSFSMSNTDLDGKGTGKAKNDIDSYTASLYWDKTGQNGYVEGSLTYGLNENKTSRLVNTAGLSRTYTGSYDSNQVSLSLGGGAPNAVGASGYVTPFIGVTGTYIKTDAYTETSNTSGDNLRLRVAQDDINSLVGKVGVKYHNVTDKGTPMISLSLNNEFGDDTINSTNTYQGGGSSFTTSTDVEPLSATLGLGYSYGSDTASIEFAYEAEANDDKYLGHYGSIKIVGKF